MLNLNDARIFVKVVDSSGFTPAARELGVPKSTVSKRVAELERELGTPLLHRTSRRFELTPVGREFHRQAAAMVALAEEAEASVRGFLVEPAGVVRITSSIPAAQMWLAEILPKLAAAHPKVQIVHHATDRFVDVVREGIDIAVRSHFAPLADSDLRGRRLRTDPFWIVASPSYLKKRGTPRHPRELALHDAALLRPSATKIALVHDDGERVTVEPKARFFTDETLMLLAAARENIGFAIVPPGFCRDDIDAGRLRRVLPEWTAGHVTTTILVPERRAELPAVRVLVDALVAHFGERADAAPADSNRSRRRSVGGKGRRQVRA